MEFQDRVVEHLLVPAGKHLPAWWSSQSDYMVKTAIEAGAIIRMNDDMAEFLEYAWAAYAGTGGELAFTNLWLLEPKVSGLGTEAPVKPQSQEVRSTSDQLAAVKAAFGLSISQLAQVLQVKRPTIYAWLDSDGGPEVLRTSNQQRLAELCGFADLWNSLSKFPTGKMLTYMLPGNVTLLSLLSEETVDNGRIAAAIRNLAKGPKEGGVSGKSLVERLRQKGFAEAPPMATLPRGADTK